MWWSWGPVLPGPSQHGKLRFAVSMCCLSTNRKSHDSKCVVGVLVVRPSTYSKKLGWEICLLSAERSRFTKCDWPVVESSRTSNLDDMWRSHARHLMRHSSKQPSSRGC